MSSNLVQNASKQASTDCGLASCQDGAMIYAGNRNIRFRSKPAELSNNLDKKECETAVHVEATFFANQSSKYNSIFAHLCFQYLLVIRYANAPDTINTRRHAHFHLFAKSLSDEQRLGLPPPVLSKAEDAKDTANSICMQIFPFAPKYS